MSGYPLKRLVDMAGSILALGLLWPLMLLIAGWIRIDSRGPAFFRQSRVGAERSTFSILKFRTLVDRPSELIDQGSEKVITAGGDPRITRAGRVLRASSLDELPQLINVLRGDMSLIGPRPIIPDQLEAVPADRLDRFRVRPGITGLAQVRGRRGLDWLDQLAFDSEYVRKCSLWLDIKIVLRTVVVVVTATGVYGGEGSNWRAYRRESSASQSVVEVRGE